MNEEARDVRPEEISIFDIYKKFGIIAADISQKWKTLLLCAVLGAGLGLCYSIFRKPDYTAVCTFVLDEGDRGPMSQFSGLASLAGIDLSGGNGGIFKGDNIFALYTSRIMLEKTLLSESDFNGKKERLIDRYVSYNKLLDRWKKSDDIEDINFNGDPLKFNRKQDSLITDITEKLNNKYLNVSKPDKKLSVIEVSFSSKDEEFAKNFTDKLVETVNTFYIISKTKKSLQNVKILQQQADSVRMVLNSSITGVASAIDASPNANPQLLTLKVPSQKKQIDVQSSANIYNAIVNNLELSKLALRQQTPLIQFLDQPVYPLKSNMVKKMNGALIGATAGFMLTLFFLVIKRVLHSVSAAAV